MTHIIVHITDDSIGVENKPTDITIEVRDHREEATERVGADRIVDGGDNTFFVQYLFEGDFPDGQDR